MSEPKKLSVITHLEMLSPAALSAKAAPPGFALVQLLPADGAKNSRLYRAVGGGWNWVDRLTWTPEAWRRYAERQELETWIGRFEGSECGYFELERQAEGNIEIVYFGLLPEFIGRGLGGPLLTAAVRRAWEIPGARRVWLHTCTEDHPQALANYLSRGFSVFRVEEA